MKLEFSRQIFEKEAQISSFIRILPVGTELFHVYGRTDGHDEANSRFLRFCERAGKRKRTVRQGCNILAFRSISHLAIRKTDSSIV
jgi:hypothetical protein